MKICTIIPFIPEVPPMWRPKDSFTIYWQDGGDKPCDVLNDADYAGWQANRLGFPLTVNAAVYQAYRLGFKVALIWNSDAELLGKPEDLLKHFYNPRIGAVAPAREFSGAEHAAEHGTAWKLPLTDPVWERVIVTQDGPLIKAMQRGSMFRAVGMDYCPLYAVNTEAFLGVGGFDPMFTPGFYEDADLWIRLRRMGYWTVVVSDVTYSHGDNKGATKSFNRIMTDGEVIMQGSRNLKLLHHKWGLVGDAEVPCGMSPFDPRRSYVSKLQAEGPPLTGPVLSEETRPEGQPQEDACKDS